MDRGTWIALIVLIVASVGFIAIQTIITSPNIPAPSPSTGTNTTDTQGSPTPQSLDTASGCQTLAADTAQNDQTATGETTSVIETNFDQALGQCYYELDIFTPSGNETDLRVAPNDGVVASCTTNTNDTLACRNGTGATITEPQFKALLTTYLGD